MDIYPPTNREGTGTDVAAYERLRVLLERTLKKVGPALFTAHGLEVVPVEESCQALPAYGLAGIVGFVGDLSGTMLLGTNTDVLVACHPMRAKIASLPTRLQLDWIAELANQLVGRMKYRLAQHRVDFDFSPPISLTGERMHHVATAGQTHRVRFKAVCGLVDVWMDAELRTEATKRSEFYADLPEEPGPEGSMILF